MAALDILSSIFTSAWGIFTGVAVPGLGVSFADLFLGVVMIRLSLALLRFIFGFGGDTGYRSGSAKNPRISDDRKDDSF